MCINFNYYLLFIYDRACVRARILRMHLYPREFGLFTRKNANALSFVRMRAFACVHLRACLRADLIKTQNVFERKIFQHSNALWVQKLSGCIYYRCEWNLWVWL